MLRRLLPEFDVVVFTKFLGNPRTYELRELGQMASSIGRQEHSADSVGNFELADTPRAALSLAQSLAGESGFVCVTGSIFLAAEVRELISHSESNADQG